jgi:hypothetical protein
LMSCSIMSSSSCVTTGISSARFKEHLPQPPASSSVTFLHAGRIASHLLRVRVRQYSVRSWEDQGLYIALQMFVPSDTLFQRRVRFNDISEFKNLWSREFASVADPEFAIVLDSVREALRIALEIIDTIKFLRGDGMFNAFARAMVVQMPKPSAVSLRRGKSLFATFWRWL